MNKKNDNDYLNQHTDNVIKRGFEIYDEWVEKRLNSRKIIVSADSAVKHFKKAKTIDAFINALAHIFALDTRIKEKYNNIFLCLFSFFSWRRETRTLKMLKSELNIPLGETDIRNSIALEIKKLAETLDIEFNEDDNDDTHGGKRNEKSEEETSAEEKINEESTEKENDVEEINDTEETDKDSEKKEDEAIEEVSQEESNEEIDNEKEIGDLSQNENENISTDEKETLVQINDENLKDENNISDDKLEITIDETSKKLEAKTYNDAVDSPPLYEESKSELSSEKTSFIDEMILDNIVKENKDVIENNAIDNLNQNKEPEHPQDTVTIQNDGNKSNENDAHLYDKNLANDKNNTQQTDKVETQKETKKVETTQQKEPKEQKEVKESIQNNGNIQSNEQEFKPVSEMLQSNNVNTHFDNNMAYDLNNTMSIESKLAYIRMQEDIFREQITISNQELGIDDNVGNVMKITEPEQISQPTVAQNIK